METKICSKCDTEKSINDFYKKGNRFHSYCKICLHNFQMERWIARKKEFINLKGGKCSTCGYDKNYGALLFHHTDPSNKDYDWNRLRLFTRERIEKELDKCIVLCANCHGELHYPQLAKK